MRGRVRERRLALRVLRRLPRLLQAVLLALLHAGIPGEEARPLQGSPVLRVDQRQGAGDAQPQRTRLAGHPATGDAGGDIELPLGPEGHERLADELLVDLVREELLQRPLVDAPLAGARCDPDPRDRLLAAAGAERAAGHHRPAGRWPGFRLGGRLGGVLRDVLAGAFLRLRVAVLSERLCGLGHGAFLVLPYRLSSSPPRGAWARWRRHLAPAGGPACCAICLIVNGAGCCA